jgi:hypothetical protein
LPEGRPHFTVSVAGDRLAGRGPDLTAAREARGGAWASSGRAMGGPRAGIGGKWRGIGGLRAGVQQNWPPDRRWLFVTPSSSSAKFGDPRRYRLAATIWSPLEKVPSQRATPPRDGRHCRGRALRDRRRLARLRRIHDEKERSYYCILKLPESIGRRGPLGRLSLFTGPVPGGRDVAHSGYLKCPLPALIRCAPLGRPPASVRQAGAY